MTWFKVKSLNYLPVFRGMENIIVSAIVEFGVVNNGIEQVAFATEIDLLKGATFLGEFIPLAEVDSEQAAELVTNVDDETIERLKLKAELTLYNTETVFFN